MNKKEQSKPRLNPGTGMAGGVIIAALIALLVSALTGDQSIWAWAIPVGLAVGLAVGAGSDKKHS
jgi:threonine/homoserine efflux transporter RhtA